MSASHIGLLFIGLAVVFLGLSTRDYLRAGPKMTPARRTWLRIGVIFAIVGVYLFVTNLGS